MGPLGPLDHVEQAARPVEQRQRHALGAQRGERVEHQRLKQTAPAITRARKDVRYVSGIQRPALNQAALVLEQDSRCELAFDVDEPGEKRTVARMRCVVQHALTLGRPLDLGHQSGYPLQRFQIRTVGYLPGGHRLTRLLFLAGRLGFLFPLAHQPRTGGDHQIRLVLRAAECERQTAFLIRLVEVQQL